MTLEGRTDLLKLQVFLADLDEERESDVCGTTFIVLRYL